jgi:hypothetical protein
MQWRGAPSRASSATSAGWWRQAPSPPPSTCGSHPAPSTSALSQRTSTSNPRARQHLGMCSHCLALCWVFELEPGWPSVSDA